jgi:hypothetical protein
MASRDGVLARLALLASALRRVGVGRRAGGQSRRARAAHRCGSDPRWRSCGVDGGAVLRAGQNATGPGTMLARPDDQPCALSLWARSLPTLKPAVEHLAKPREHRAPSGRAGSVLADDAFSRDRGGVKLTRMRRCAWALRQTATAPPRHPTRAIRRSRRCFRRGAHDRMTAPYSTPDGLRCIRHTVDFPHMMIEHTITVRDLRLRYGAPEVFAAQRSRGWMGEERRGRTGERTALWDGNHHRDRARITRPRRPRA